MRGIVRQTVGARGFPVQILEQSLQRIRAPLSTLRTYSSAAKEPKRNSHKGTLPSPAAKQASSCTDRQSTFSATWQARSTGQASKRPNRPLCTTSLMHGPRQASAHCSSPQVRSFHEPVQLFPSLHAAVQSSNPNQAQVMRGPNSKPAPCALSSHH